MKTRILHFFSFISATLLLLTGCLEQLPDTDAVTPSLKDGDVVKVCVSASTLGYSIDASTKSKYSFNENATNNLCIGVYDKETDEKVAEKYGLSVNTKIEFDLIVGRTYMFVALANHHTPYGSGTGQRKFSSTYSELISENITATPYMQNGAMMGIVEHTVTGMYGDNSNNQYSNVVIPLQRCYAKFRIKVNQAIGTNFTVKSINVKQVITSDFWFFQPEKCYRRSDGSENAEANTAGDSWVAGTNEAPSDGYYILYCPENRMGTPASLASNTDPKNKNPETDANYKGKCTYIELVVEGTAPLNGTVTYKFYPGANNYNNFDIQRNTVYNITVNLSENIYETTWRVDPQWDYNLGTPTKTGVSDLTLGKTQSISFTFPSASYYYWLSDRLIKARFVDTSTGAIIGETQMSVPKLSYTTGLKPGTTVSFTVTPIDEFNTGYLQLYDDHGKVIYTDNTAISCTIPEIYLKDSDGNRVYDGVSSTINGPTKAYYLTTDSDIDLDVMASWFVRHNYEVVIKMDESLCSKYSSFADERGFFPYTAINGANAGNESSFAMFNITTTNSESACYPLTWAYADFYQNGPDGSICIYNGENTISVTRFGVNASPVSVKLIGRKKLSGSPGPEKDFCYFLTNPSGLVLDIITSLSSNEDYPGSNTQIDETTGRETDYRFIDDGGYFVHEDLFAVGSSYKAATTYSRQTDVATGVTVPVPTNLYSYKKEFLYYNPNNTSLDGYAISRYKPDHDAGEYLVPCFPSGFEYNSADELTIIDCQIRLSGTTINAVTRSIPLEYQIGSKSVSYDFISESRVIKFYAQLWNGSTFIASSDGSTTSHSRVWNKGFTAQSIYDLVHDIKHSSASMSLNTNGVFSGSLSSNCSSLSKKGYVLPLTCSYWLSSSSSYVKDFLYEYSSTGTCQLSLTSNLLLKYWMKSCSNVVALASNVYSTFAQPTGSVEGRLHLNFKSGYSYMALPSCTYSGSYSTTLKRPSRTDAGVYYDSSSTNPDGTSRGNTSSAWTAKTISTSNTYFTSYMISIPETTLMNAYTVPVSGDSFVVYMPDGDFYN